MDPIKITIQSIPRILYTKYSNVSMVQSHVSAEQVLVNLAGNPDGSKVSTIPYIYCLGEEDVEEHEYDSIYFLRVHFDWPLHGFIAEEAKDGKMFTYEDYKREGYIGVKRYFADTWKYVIFDPESCIRSIYDVGKQEVVYEKKHSLHIKDETLNGDKSRGLLVTHDKESQEQIDAMMLEKIGSDYIDRKKDVFCLSEIARRQGCSVTSIYRRLVNVLHRITVCKASGCWISSYRSDYKRTFWFSMGGLSHSDIFTFSSHMEDDPNIVIKNKNILHSQICELTWGKKHSKCCRPMHLRLGTSKENAIHIKVRKNMEQLFDFSPNEMRRYAYHIYSLSNLVETQLQIMRPAEKKVMEKRKGNKIIIYENANGKYIQKVIGTPDMGESELVKKKDMEQDPLGIKELFSQDSHLTLAKKYKRKLLSEEA